MIRNKIDGGFSLWEQHKNKTIKKRDYYKLQNGDITPETIAMSIVYNLGDELYKHLADHLSHPKYMAIARQKTNDEFLEYAEDLIYALLEQNGLRTGNNEYRR